MVGKMEKEWEQLELPFDREEKPKKNIIDFKKCKEKKDKESLYALADHLTRHLRHD